MAEVSVATCNRAIRTRLLTNQTVWGTRVHAHIAPAGTALPFVVYFHMGGGGFRFTKSPSANEVFGVKCVASDLDTAIAGANLINTLLDDSGSLDTATPLDDGSYWRINTVTAEETIAIAELVSTSTKLYHYGAKYRFYLTR